MKFRFIPSVLLVLFISAQLFLGYLINIYTGVRLYLVLGIIILTIFSIILFFLVDIKKLIFLAIFVSFFHGFIKNIFYNNLWAYLILDFLVVLIFVKWLVSKIILREKIKATSLIIPLVSLLILSLLEFFNPARGPVLKWLAGLRSWNIYWPIYLIAFDTFKTKRQIVKLLRIFVVVSLIVALYGISQYFTGLEYLDKLSPGFSFRMPGSGWQVLEKDLAITRVYSTTVTPNTLGNLICTFIIFSLTLLFIKKGGGFSSFFLIVCSIVGGITLLLTFTRASIIILIVQLPLFMFLTKKVKKLLFIPIIFVVAALLIHYYIPQAELFPERFSDIKDLAIRKIQNTFKHSLSLSKESLWGRGLGLAGGIPKIYIGGQEGYRVTSIDNEFGRSLAEMGWLGFIIFTFLLVVVVWHSFKNLKYLQNDARVIFSGVVTATVVPFVIQSWVGNTMAASAPSLIFWLLVGILLSKKIFIKRNVNAKKP